MVFNIPTFCHHQHNLLCKISLPSLVSMTAKKLILEIGISCIPPATATQNMLSVVYPATNISIPNSIGTSFPVFQCAALMPFSSLRDWFFARLFSPVTSCLRESHIVLLLPLLLHWTSFIFCSIYGMTIFSISVVQSHIHAILVIIISCNFFKHTI